MFDLLYSIVFRDEYGVIRREVIATFIKKSIFESNPNDARNQLLAVSLEAFKEQWLSITAPIVSLFAFEFVVSNFAELINSLFALLMPAPAAAGGRFAATAPRPTVRSISRRSVALGRNYFATDARLTIINAGRTRTMISLLYDGYERLIEPYKLEYYVRKSDGRGSEYFWGYDISGGRSGTVGIKQFICDKIQAVHPTSRGFSPRFPIEL